MEYTKRTSCAGCGNTELITLLDLGSVPFVGEFPSKVDLDNQRTTPKNEEVEKEEPVEQDETEVVKEDPEVVEEQPIMEEV